MTAHRPSRAALAPTLALVLAACSPARDQPAAPPPAPENPAPRPAAIQPVAPIEAAPAAAAAPGGTPTPSPAPTPAPSAAARAIDQATFSAATPAPGSRAIRDMLIRAQVLLDRAGFSPGAIDGRLGGNLKGAIGAYEAAHALPVDGRLTEAVWDTLTRADPAPVATDYVVTADDVKGPFLAKAPTDMEAMSKLDRMAFTGPAQLLAEKFHMDQALLAALNPGADLGAVGTTLVVTAPGAATPAAAVARIEVDKATRQVRALDQSGKALAVFPATVGSAERPAPSGTWAVRDIARNPDYTFDPARLTFGKSKRKLTIPPGPNNPVGSTWIGLTKDTYGIHGAPDPTRVGKVASHGCVRLTNWDARRLAGLVKAGTPVVFVGQTAS